MGSPDDSRVVKGNWLNIKKCSLKISTFYNTCCVITPLPEDQRAVLPVEWEVGDLYRAGAAVDGWGQPVHGAITID